MTGIALIQRAQPAPVSHRNEHDAASPPPGDTRARPLLSCRERARGNLYVTGIEEEMEFNGICFFKREYLNAIIRFDKLGVINFPTLYCYALYKIYPPFYFFIIQYAVANESENFEVSYGYAWRRIVCVVGYCVFFQK